MATLPHTCPARYWLLTGVFYVCAETTGQFTGARLQLKDDSVLAIIATFFFLAGRALASLLVGLLHACFRHSSAPPLLPLPVAADVAAACPVLLQPLHLCCLCICDREICNCDSQLPPPPHPHPDALTWAPDPLPSTLLSPQISLRESWRYGHSKTLRAGSRYVDSPVCTRALW